MTLQIYSHQKLAYTLVFSLLALLFSGFCFANEPSTSKPDEEQPIEVTANSLDASEQTGQSTYRGQVVITQGSTEIRGDIITLIHPNSTLESAVATGQPATFKRFIADKQKWIHGHANKITYNAKLKTLQFEGDAFVEQEGNNSIQGPEIFYDIAQKTLTAKGSSETQQRIKVIFTPEKENEAVDSAPKTEEKP